MDRIFWQLRNKINEVNKLMSSTTPWSQIPETESIVQRGRQPEEVLEVRQGVGNTKSLFFQCVIFKNLIHVCGEIPNRQSDV